MLRLALALLIAALASCKDDSLERGDILIEGRVSGLEAGRSARAAVIWTLTTGAPDYAYGEGDAEGDGFAVRMRSSPPSDALNAGDVGVGLVALVADGAAVPSGPLAEGATDSLVGVSARTAIIYRQGDPPATIPWAASFPSGLSCGRCVEARGSATVETYEPIPCPSVEVLAATAFSSADVCRWR